MNGGPTKVTLAVVATAAGVSVATVSKVVNGRPDVSAATRARVLELLRQHDYGRNRDSLRAHPTLEMYVGAGRLTPFGAEILEGVLDAAAAADVDVVVSAGNRLATARAPREWAHGLVTAGRLAVIGIANRLTDEQVMALERVRMPLVVVDPQNTPPSVAAISVRAANFDGGRAAAQHVVRLGHRRIAFLGGPASAGSSRARLHGYRSVLEEAGLPVPAGLIRHADDFDYDKGIVAGGALLDLPGRPTAVLAANDELAAGVIEAARRRRLVVPDELSVVGFDGTPIATLTSPPLTTVRQPLPEMGAVALRTALRLAAGEKADSSHVELATQLIIRESTRRLAE